MLVFVKANLHNVCNEALVDMEDDSCIDGDSIDSRSDSESDSDVD